MSQIYEKYTHTAVVNVHQLFKSRYRHVSKYKEDAVMSGTPKMPISESRDLQPGKVVSMGKTACAQRPKTVMRLLLCQFEQLLVCN